MTITGRAGARRGDARPWAAMAIAAASSVLLVALVAQLPMAILAGAGHDDAWFWQRAESILAGHWMGPYGRMTLIKGSGYPLFLAFNHVLGLPLTTTQALLYAGACLLLGSAVYRMGGRPWLALGLVLALQWHPSAMAWTRVLRDSIGGAQILLALACLLHFACATRAGRRGWWWAGGAGLAFAWMWTTREDAIWAVPGLALLVLARGVQAWRTRDERRRLAAGTVVVAIAFCGWLSLVAAVNQAKYGVFITVETRESGFADALAALQRVRVGDPVPFVPVPHDVRLAVYGASPAFARLQPFLEGPGLHWTRSGCGNYPHACGDYAGGWFIWALRDAVAAIDGYRSAPVADAFYRQVADEVRQACATGRLACGPEGFGEIPPIAASQWRTVPGRMRTALSLLFWQGVGDGQTVSHLQSRHVVAMWEFVGKPMVPDERDLLGTRASGWFHAPPPEWLRLRCAGGEVAVDRRPSADIARHFRDQAAGHSRFAVVVPSVDSCVFESTGPAGAVPVPDADGARRGFRLGSGQLYIDSVHPGIPQDAEAPRWARWLKYRIGLVYAAVLPWLATAAVLAFAWATLVAARRRRLEPLYLLAATAWALLAGRVALLVLVDMSSFPAIKVHYMQPAFPLLVLAVVASLALLRGRGAPSPQGG